MTVKYQSRDFHPDKVFARYAAYRLIEVAPPYDKRGFMVFDVNAAGQTIRETIVTESDLPHEIVKECVRLADQAFNQVKLPDEPRLDLARAH